LCLTVLIAESYHERAVIAKLYHIVQFSADGRKKATSSKLWVRRPRSLAVHTVSVDRAEPRGRGATTTVLYNKICCSESCICKKVFRLLES